jgi:hypothetical protein
MQTGLRSEGNAIEPVIGHEKQDHRLGRNHLKGKEGDCINALLSGRGFNLRKLLRECDLPIAMEVVSSSPSAQTTPMDQGEIFQMVHHGFASCREALAPCGKPVGPYVRLLEFDRLPVNESPATL